MPQTSDVRIKPIEATTVIAIPEAVVYVMLATGSFSHILCFSFDFVSGSHFVQLVDPLFVLIVPCGHLIHSQQHGEVISLLVPGKHSDEQKDKGVEKFFHSNLDIFIFSFGVASLFQAPIQIFWRALPVVESSWKFMMSYEALKGSPNLSNRTLPVQPSKLIFLRYFFRSLPLTFGLIEGQVLLSPEPCMLGEQR